MRKYSSEFTLAVAVGGAYLLRVQDLPKVDAAQEATRACHIYVISRAPRVSVNPQSVLIENDYVDATVNIHRAGNPESHDFRTANNLGAATWESDWPHEDYRLRAEDGSSLSSGPCAFLFASVQDEHDDSLAQEILYIGQAFGEAGERTAWPRLRNHETLQRILAEQSPDKQVWLTLAEIVDVNAIQEISPQPSSATAEENARHMREVLQLVYSEGFKNKEAVSLAEAGLIRGWRPQYNTRLKEHFPAKNQVPLATARGLDIHSLVVEWQSTELPFRYYCESRPDETRVLQVRYP